MEHFEQPQNHSDGKMPIIVTNGESDDLEKWVEDWMNDFANAIDNAISEHAQTFDEECAAFQRSLE